MELILFVEKQTIKGLRNGGAMEKTKAWQGNRTCQWGAGGKFKKSGRGRSKLHLSRSCS